MDRIVDLRSDTVTKPTPKMRAAMMSAEVGDDCYGEDPTVNELERIAAEKVGKEAAVYVPTGTMGNTASILAHTNPGDNIVVDIECHIYYYERGNMASLGGVMPVVMASDDGCPEPDKVEEYLQRDITRFPRTSLVCLENTHNRRGGRTITLERMKAIREVTEKYDRPVHLDGARIFNAAHALGVEAREIASHVDSVMFCLSKGLSAPVGSMIAGSAEFIRQARIARKRLGGAMRQA
ncbi:MAG: threonine aldolase family protein, partial [Candidatus Poribacteria bacterium]